MDAAPTQPITLTLTSSISGVVGGKLPRNLVTNSVRGNRGHTVGVGSTFWPNGGGADGIVVTMFHVRQVGVPVVWYFVDDHREHLSHGMIDALDATVAVGVASARRDFPHA